MQLITKASDILASNLNQSLALRRNVRIRSSKLPPDFFVPPSSQRYVPSPIIFRPIGNYLSNRQPRTPSFQCRKREIKLTDETIDHERKVETARISLEKIDNEDELISVVLSSTNKLRRVARKQSLDMKHNYRNILEDRQLRLPQIVNKAAKRY